MERAEAGLSAADAQAVKADVEATCPYCAAVLVKRPKRKSRCKACGNSILVKTLLDTRERVLVTEEQARSIEATWDAHYQRRVAEQAVQRYALSLEVFRARRAAYPDRADRDLIWSMFNESIEALIRSGDFGALKSRYYEMALFCAQDNRSFTHLLEKSHEMELRSYLESGVVQNVEVQSAGHGNSCSACLRLHGTVFRIAEALQIKPLPCSECTTDVVGTKAGFCRCCYIAVID